MQRTGLTVIYIKILITLITIKQKKCIIINFQMNYGIIRLKNY